LPLNGTNLYSQLYLVAGAKEASKGKSRKKWSRKRSLLGIDEHLRPFLTPSYKLPLRASGYFSAEYIIRIETR